MATFQAIAVTGNTIRNLLGEGTLLASFIPVYATFAERDKRAGRALAGAILGLLLLASGVLAVLGVALAPVITTLIAKGFDEPRRQLTITLVRILFPMTGLMVISAWCLGILNTHRRFFLPYAAPAVWSVAGIVAMLAAGTWFANRALPLDAQLHRLSLALAWGTVAGSLLQIAVQLPACWRLLGGIALRVTTGVTADRPAGDGPPVATPPLAAIVTATGRAPGNTPANQLGTPSSSPAVILVLLLPLVASLLLLAGMVLWRPEVAPVLAPTARPDIAPPAKIPVKPPDSGIKE